MADIAQPRWKEPEYSRKQVNNAGNIMRKQDATDEEVKKAIQVIDNWRASHAYPMQVFYMNLHRMQGSRTDVVVAQRLKRLSSIIAKLKEQPEMELWRMHDLGGCRIIFPTIDEVYRYSNELEFSHIRHKVKRKYDYINEPKPSGYRSLHLVYRFQSDTPNKAAFNRNMLIELQFRTHLQHIWATAMETIGLFTHQALKAGHGSEDILRFFVLVSSLFAIKEGYPVAPGTVADENELISEIEQIDNKTHVLDMLDGIRIIIGAETQQHRDKRGYYILMLNYETPSVSIQYFLPSESERANTEYSNLETIIRDMPIDAVLVRATSMASVRAAYPNYFLDIEEFVNLVSSYLK